MVARVYSAVLSFRKHNTLISNPLRYVDASVDQRGAFRCVLFFDTTKGEWFAHVKCFVMLIEQI